MTFGTRMAIRRRELGISQKSLAKAIGMSPSAVCKMEHDVMKPNDAVLTKIHAILGLDNASSEHNMHIVDGEYIALENLEKQVTDIIRELENTLGMIRTLKIFNLSNKEGL